MDSRLYHQIAAIRAAEDHAYAAAMRTIRAARGQDTRRARELGFPRASHIADDPA